MLSKTTPEQDLHPQYTNRINLLSTAIAERDQLLQELAAVAQAPQGKGTLERFVRFDIATAQTFLFRLSILMNRIDSLIVQITVTRNAAACRSWG